MQLFNFTIRQLLEAIAWAAVELLCLRESAAPRHGPIHPLAGVAIGLAATVAVGNLFGTFIGNRMKCCVMVVCLWPLTMGIFLACASWLAWVQK